MKPIHVGRRDITGTRKLYTKVSRKHCVGGKNILGKLKQDWCQDDKYNIVMGWFWVALDGEYGETFPRMRDAVADFERERRARSDNRKTL